MTERTCNHCGATYMPRKNVQKYCSEQCAQQTHLLRAKAKRDAARVPTACGQCGKPFLLFRNRKFCSKECAAANSKANSRRTVKREMTELTVYLCHKWCKEGYTPAEIAQYILECPIALVHQALEQPISEMQEARIERYFCPRRRVFK